MPIDKGENEWSAIVRQSNEFEFLVQLWPSKSGSPNYPFNSFGIRGVGGKIKKEDKVAEHSIRFSTKTKFKWTEAKIRKWIADHGFELKDFKELKGIKEFDYYKEQKQQKFKFKTPDFKIITREHEDGRPLIIEGVINSSSVDAYNEIVSPDAVMKSIDFYERYPTVRWMHGPQPIGKTLKIWKEGDFVKARIEIDGDETKVISKILKGTVRAFSIGFMALSWDRFCPKKNECVRRFTDILLIEISPVDSPANRDAMMTDVNFKSLNLEDYYSEDEDGVLESLNLKEEDFHTTHLCDTKEDKKMVKEIIEELESNESNRGIKMPDEKKEKKEEEEVDEEESKKKKKEEEEEEESSKSTEEVSDKEKKTESDGTEKILEALAAMSLKVDATAKEVELMKMSEEDRKTAEEIDTKVQSELKIINEKNAELTKELAENKKKLEIREEVEKQVAEITSNQPPVRQSMSPGIETQTKNPDDSRSEDDIELEKVLLRYIY